MSTTSQKFKNKFPKNQYCVFFILILSIETLDKKLFLLFDPLSILLKKQPSRF